MQGRCSNFNTDPSAFGEQVRRESRVTQPPALLLISSASGQKGPRQEAVGFLAANPVSESCQILAVAIGPHQKWCREPLRVPGCFFSVFFFPFLFKLQRQRGTPSGCCHLRQTPKCLQNFTIKSKSSVGNTGSLNKPRILRRGTALHINWRGSLGFDCFMWLCFFFFYPFPYILNIRVT